MFEELCRKTGTIRIPTGEYADSAPVFEEHTVSYFVMNETFRNAEGVQQSENHIYCKGYFQEIPVEAKNFSRSSCWGFCPTVPTP